MKPKPPPNDYLWDGEGAPDGRVAELEELLAKYRRAAPPPFRRDGDPRSGATRLDPRRRPQRPQPEIGRGWYWAAAAAVAAGVAWAALFVRDTRLSREWTVTTARGSARLARGGTVSTGAGKTVQLSSPAIGAVDVGENTTLRLTDSREGRTTLELAVGTIHARTMSPPGVFVVETPRARAVDLGCEYTLRVEPTRAGRLHVDSGWVALVRSGRQSLVPERASAVFDMNGQLTPPWFDDAHPDFGAAVRRFSILTEPAPQRAAALDRILALARPRDGLTLLNFFARPELTREERLRIYDRLNALVPAPPGVTREGAASGTIAATEPWWPPVRNAAGVGPIKKEKMRRPPA